MAFRLLFANIALKSLRCRSWNGSPTGYDESFNGIVIRAEQGQQLINDASDAGFITLGDPITIDQFNDFQPHQVQKKQALKWRYDGLQLCGSVTIDAPHSRIDVLGEGLAADQRQKETDGTIKRFGKQLDSF